jgi:hypothetical protein
LFGSAANQQVLSDRREFWHPTRVPSDLRQSGGWVAALEAAELILPPATTLRVTAANRHHPCRMAETARAAGIVAAHNGRCKWIEVQGALARVCTVINDIDVIEAFALWEPRTETLEYVGRSARGSQGRS